MESILLAAIRDECKKLIDRHNEYLFFLNDEITRRNKRLGITSNKTVQTPSSWSLSRAFNPFKTRYRADTYAYAIACALRKGTYEPAVAAVQTVPKADGSLRLVNVFQIPDSAISRIVYKSLLRKNVARFSSYAYAYREDRLAHDAVKELSSEWRRLKRVYVAEFDYSKFFDNIRHEYIWQSLERHGFITTFQEREVIAAFLDARASPHDKYSAAAPERRIQGIPQGTSISLFLANVVCFELDRSLERLGVAFARYADDTLIWSPDYARVIKAFEQVEAFGEEMGVPINFDKSEGVHLITCNPAKAEIKCKTSVHFLGHTVSLTNVAIKDSHVKKIKKRVSFLIYKNLLQPLKWGYFIHARLGPDVDYDYLVAVMQIRRYLYGGLTHRKLMSFLRGQTPRLTFRGLMSFYPLVDDLDQLRALDGWLIHTFRSALALRQRLWAAHGVANLPGPTTGWINTPEDLEFVSSADGHVYDFHIPSFVLVNSAISKAIKQAGLGGFSVSKTLYYM